MRREWQPEELIASWTLIDRDWELLANKSGATRLGFALLLRFFDLEAQVPRASGRAAAGRGRVCRRAGEGPAGRAGGLRVVGRTIKYHRAQIRRAFGFREPTRADEQRLTEWLAEEVCSVELAGGAPARRAAVPLP